MELLHNLVLGFSVLLQPVNLFLFHRGAHRNAGRRAAGPGSGGGHVPPLARHLQAFAPCRHHHAGGDLLRGHVRRLHHFHPGQHPRGSGLGRHLPGRLPDGPQGAGRPGPGDCGLRLLHRRDDRHRGLMLVAPPLARIALKFGPPEYFSLMILGLMILILSRQRLHGQSLDDGRLRAVRRAPSGMDRHGGHAPVHLQSGCPHGRRGTRARGHGPLRDLRGPAEYRGRRSSRKSLKTKLKVSCPT